MKLRSFYFAHDGLFVIPIEHLRPEGMTSEMADAVREHGKSDAWIQMFDDAYSRYWQRATVLSTKAPTTWFPPRRQHVCVARDLESARPYSQPFDHCSWLFYESDFEPEQTSIELATYLFFHTERYGIARNVMAAGVHNIAYFFVRDADEIDDFKRGCARATRPDADALRCLAEHTEVFSRIYHVDLKPPASDTGEQMGKLEAADLLVPISCQQHLKVIASAYRSTGEQVADAYYKQHASNAGGGFADAICKWLAADAPRVLVTGEAGILWDPDKASETKQLRAVLEGIHQRPADSIRADLEVISDRTVRFLAKLRNPDALPKPHELDQEAGTYIHEDRKLIAYDVEHKRMNRLREASPPYERLMLGARTIHEWSHLAVDAGVVGVPDDRTKDFADRQKDVAELLDTIIAHSASDKQRIAEEEAKLLGGQPNAAGVALTKTMMSRMEDFMANLLARAVLSPEEMETYVRANVVSRSSEMHAGPWIKLARYAYEYQYLLLSQMDEPFDYFIESTWFRQHHIEAGIISEAHTRALFKAVGEVCACYAIVGDALLDAEQHA
jgi:hypothetical protein